MYMYLCLLSNIHGTYREAQYYHKVMKKVIEKGGEFVQTESDRLARMLSKWGRVVTPG